MLLKIKQKFPYIVQNVQNNVKYECDVTETKCDVTEPCDFRLAFCITHNTFHRWLGILYQLALVLLN